MRRNRAFTTIELVIVMVITAILLSVGIVAVKKFINNARIQVCNQQAQALQSALNAWVARQSSINAAVSQFQASSDPAVFIPADLSGLLTLVSATLAQDNDSLRTNDGVYVVSDALVSANGHLAITWPKIGGSLRASYPRVELVISPP